MKSRDSLLPHEDLRGRTLTGSQIAGGGARRAGARAKRLGGASGNILACGSENTRLACDRCTLGRLGRSG